MLYALVVVELEERVRRVSEVANVPPGELRVGMGVEVASDAVTERVTLAKFSSTAGDKLMCHSLQHFLAIAVVATVAAASPASALDCVLRFYLESDVTLSSLEVEVDGSAREGEWIPISPEISTEICRSRGDWTVAGTEDAGSGTLRITAASSGVAFIDGPVEFGECAYASVGSPPILPEFVVQATAALDQGSQPAIVSVSLMEIDCEQSTSTTTTLPTTTTTLSPTTTTPSTSTTASTTTTLVGGDACGDPVGLLTLALEQPAVVNATDSLFTLEVAVGLASCELCVCDVDSSSDVTATDSLLILRAAVGLPVTLDCQPC